MALLKTMSNTRFSLGLRSHIFLLQASVMVVLVFFLYAFWTPSLLERERFQYTSSIQSHINTVGEMMVPVILDNQIASIYEILDSLLNTNPAWETIELFDGDGRHVYPLEMIEPKTDHLHDSSQMFVQPIMLNGAKLGELRLHVNFKNHLASTQSAYQQLVIVFLCLLFFVGMLGAMVGEFSIRRPIGALVKVAERMAQNDFGASLPTSRLTELNLLINRFSIMRKRMLRHHEDLKNTVEEQTNDLRRNAAFTRMILETMPSAVIVHDSEGVTMANRSAVAMLNLSRYEIETIFLRDALTAVGLSQKDANAISSGAAYRHENFTYPASSKGNVHLSISQTLLQQASDEVNSRYLIVADDVSAQIDAQSEKEKLESDLLQAQKLEAVGQLAGGIAHEINTPSQYIGDNLQFLSEAQEEVLAILNRLLELNNKCSDIELVAADVAEINKMIEDGDLPYLLEEIPTATEQSINGISEVSRIVLAMKDFSHPGSKEMSACDINKAVSTTLIVSKGEWKSVAVVEENFADDLPLINCFLGEINQVLLNLVINAAHAIGEKQTSDPGKITVSTVRHDDLVQIKISDNGNGVPVHIRDQIFNPFFTTKEVGKGTGQGLAIARDIVAVKHGGDLSFETEDGVGTTFTISLPIERRESVAQIDDADMVA